MDSLSATESPHLSSSYYSSENGTVGVSYTILTAKKEFEIVKNQTFTEPLNFTTDTLLLECTFNLSSESSIFIAAGTCVVFQSCFFQNYFLVSAGKGAVGIITDGHFFKYPFENLKIKPTELVGRTTFEWGGDSDYRVYLQGWITTTLDITLDMGFLSFNRDVFVDASTLVFPHRIYFNCSPEFFNTNLLMAPPNRDYRFVAV